MQKFSYTKADNGLAMVFYRYEWYKSKFKGYPSHKIIFSTTMVFFHICKGRVKNEYTMSCPPVKIWELEIQES